MSLILVPVESLCTTWPISD